MILIVQGVAMQNKVSDNDSKWKPVENSVCSDLWFIPGPNGTCHCGITDHDVVMCDNDTKEITVLDCYCMTKDSKTDHMVVGECFYTCSHSSQYDCGIAPTNCTSLNRRGTLCGDCDNDTLPPAYSYDMECIKCSHNYGLLKYIAVAFLPLTIFIAIVLIFRISIVSPKLRGFVLYCQIYAAPINVRPILLSSKHRSALFNAIARVYITLFGVWNLDFFRTLYPGICLHLTELQVLALDYLVAVYPMVVIITAYVLVSLHYHGFRPVLALWRPFHCLFARFRQEWNIQTSIVDAFVTFFILSTTKMFNVSFDLLIPTQLYIASGDSLNRQRLYYNPNIIYMGDHHLKFALIALAVFTVFILIPFILLMMTSCSKYSRLRECLYPFQKYYKDGTEGTADCRWFSSFYIMMFMITFVTYTFALNIMMYYICVVLFIIPAVVVLIVEPYKEEHYNKLDSVVYLWISLVFASVCAFNTSKHLQIIFSMYITLFLVFISAVPLLYIIVVAITWIRDRPCQRHCQEEATVEESLPYRIAHSNEYRS